MSGEQDGVRPGSEPSEKDRRLAGETHRRVETKQKIHIQPTEKELDEELADLTGYKRRSDQRKWKYARHRGGRR